MKDAVNELQKQTQAKIEEAKELWLKERGHIQVRVGKKRAVRVRKKKLTKKLATKN